MIIKQKGIKNQVIINKKTININIIVNGNTYQWEYSEESKKEGTPEKQCLAVVSKDTAAELENIFSLLDVTVNKFQIKKSESLKLRNVYLNILKKEKSKRYLNKAERVEKCASFLEFWVSKDCRKKKLIRASFCKDRLCPTCAWRRSLKNYIENKKCFDELTKEGGRFLFLTLTCKNVKDLSLKDEIDKYMISFRKLMKNKLIKPYVLGTIRALEVTYNEKSNMYHPHVHVLIHVRSEYFGKGYIKQNEWREMWEECAGLDYFSQVDIRAFKSKTEGKEIGRELAEISKYCVKFGDFIDLPENEMTKVIEVLDDALYHRQLIGYSGSFGKVRKRLKLKDDIEDNQESSLDEIEENEEGYRILYFWNFEKNQYERDSDEIN